MSFSDRDYNLILKKTSPLKNQNEPKCSPKVKNVAGNISKIQKNTILQSKQNVQRVYVPENIQRLEEEYQQSCMKNTATLEETATYHQVFKEHTELSKKIPQAHINMYYKNMTQSQENYKAEG